MTSKGKRKDQGQDSDDEYGGADEPTNGPSKKVKVKDDEVDPPVDNDNDESPPLDEQQESSEANPFLLNPVLEIMMSCMTIDDLKRSRGVCQLWDSYSCKELEGLTSQRKPVQRFLNADDVHKFRSSLEDSPNKVWISNKIATTLNAISSASDEEGFFHNFKPESLTINKFYYNSTSVLIKTLQNSSEYIKELCVEGSFSHERQILWPENLKFTKLESLTLKNNDLSWFCPQNVHLIIQNIIEKAPKLKGFNFGLGLNRFTNQLSDLFISSGVIMKLESFGVIYRSFRRIDNCVFAQDMLNMALAGLKLKTFDISLMFDFDDSEVILGQFELLKQFLTLQSDTLNHLTISIGWSINININAKMNIPSLSKLKVLDIVNHNAVDNSNQLFYDPMDLPSIFPNLREITIDLKFDLDGLSGIFIGSLDYVIKVRVKHPEDNSFKNSKNYRHLEAYFPHVLEFEVDQMEKHNCDMRLWNKQYEHIPWRNTLKKLILHPHPDKFEFLKLESLSHLKELRQLELINTMTSTLSLTKLNDFNYESLARTCVKSLKIRNFLINEDDLVEIRSRFTLDFGLDPLHVEAQKNENLSRIEERSLPRRSSRVINHPSKS